MHDVRSTASTKTHAGLGAADAADTADKQQRRGRSLIQDGARSTNLGKPHLH